MSTSSSAAIRWRAIESTRYLIRFFFISVFFGVFVGFLFIFYFQDRLHLLEIPMQIEFAFGLKLQPPSGVFETARRGKDPNYYTGFDLRDKSTLDALRKFCENMAKIMYIVSPRLEECVYRRDEKTGQVWHYGMYGWEYYYCVSKNYK